MSLILHILLGIMYVKDIDMHFIDTLCFCVSVTVCPFWPGNRLTDAKNRSLLLYANLNVQVFM